MTKLPIKNLFAVEVPMDAYDVQIYDNVMQYEVPCKELDFFEGLTAIPLPSDNYTLISSDIRTITESEALTVVESFEEPKNWINYVDYVNGGKETKGDGRTSIVVGFNTALLSLHSAFQKVGICWRNELGELNQHLVTASEPGDLSFLSKEWHTAQQSVKRFALLKKEGE